jgi:hypothetical protein
MSTLDYWRRVRRKQKQMLVRVAVEEARPQTGFALVLANGRLHLPVKEYLLTVLPGMSARKHSEVALLTPARCMGPGRFASRPIDHT